MKISEKITYLRKEKCWSQEQLASKLEVSRQAVYKWEADINQPDLDKLKKIAQIFNVSYDILMDDSVDLPITPNIVEINNNEIPEVEILEKATPQADTKVVKNEVAVQINYSKEPQKSSNKKLIATLCVLASVFVICLCILSYVIFGIVLQKESYLVKFDTQGGSYVSDLVIKEGRKITGLTTPTREGYTFDGWYIGDRKWDFDKDTIKSNTSLTAKWIPNKITVTLIDSETGRRAELITYTDSTVILSTDELKKEGYVISGWATTPSGAIEYENYQSVKIGHQGLTLYAVWKKADYKLTLNLNGGKFSSYTPPSGFSENDSFTLPSPTKSHYHFDGWIDSHGVLYEKIEKGTKQDISLTATYTPIIYTITYELFGGINNPQNPEDYNTEASVTFLPPENGSYTFLGWYLDADFKTKIVKTQLGSGGNITLYARWETADFSFMHNGHGYTLIGYSGNEGQVIIPSQYEGVNVTKIGDTAFAGNTEIFEIYIPSTISEISAIAFEEIETLSWIEVDPYNPKYSSLNGILYSKDQTTLYKYPPARTETVFTADYTLDVIAPYAFSFAIYLESVNLPNDASLQTGVGKIGAYAFDGCISLKEIELGYLCNYLETGCFRSCWSLESIELKANRVWGIEASAFEDCFSLESVRFLGTVDAIGDLAFFGTIKLKEINLPGIKNLGASVFKLSSLSSVFLPSTLTNVGENQFTNSQGIIVRCEASERPNGWSSNWSNGATNVYWSQSNTADFCDIKYREDTENGGLIITECIGIGNVEIPEKINDMPVVEIYRNAFSDQRAITSIKIPKTVKLIAGNAFNDCVSLEKITVDGSNKNYMSYKGILFSKDEATLIRYPAGKRDLIYNAHDSLKVIDDYAFCGNIYIDEINLACDSSGTYGVTKIGDYAFYGCVGLNKIEMGYKLNNVGVYAFSNCLSLEKIEFKTNEACSIGECSFESCMSLTSVKLGKVEKIGAFAFKATALSEIFVSSTVKEIGINIFDSCENLTVYCEMAEINKPIGWSDGWSNNADIIVWGQPIPPVETKFEYVTSGSYASITGCTGSGEIKIPSTIDGYTVSSIGAGAFSGNDEITKITIPSYVHAIEATAFDNCPKLEAIIFEGTHNYYFGSIDGVLYKDSNKQIYKYPEGKKNKTFTVPYHVDIITAYAFKDNHYLTKVILPSDVVGNNYVGKLEQGAFQGCTALTAVEGCAATYLERDVFRDCSDLTEITFLADDVWGIGNYSFLNCTSLESVTFEGNMHTIGYQVFGFCSSLKNVTFNGTLASLSMHAFEGCLCLNEITIPEGPTAMISEAFKGCINLTKINIPSSVTKIEDYAFLDTGIKEIFIPATVTEIEEYAFYSLENVTIYCEVAEKPLGWNDKWNAISNEENTLYHTVKWAQNGLPVV